MKKSQGDTVYATENPLLMGAVAARRIIDKRADRIIGRQMADILAEAWHDMQEIFRTGQPQIARRGNIGTNVIIANRMRL